MPLVSLCIWQHKGKENLDVKTQKTFSDFSSKGKIREGLSLYKIWATASYKNAIVSPAITILTIDMSLIRILRDGPDVSLNGSPTVSPTMVAL